MTRSPDGLALGALVALLALALGIVLVFAAARTVTPDVSRPVPCCPAGTGGQGGPRP